MSIPLTAMSLEAVIRGVAHGLGRNLAVMWRLRMPPRTLSRRLKNNNCDTV